VSQLEACYGYFWEGPRQLRVYRAVPLKEPFGRSGPLADRRFFELSSGYPSRYDIETGC
jgi:hypothetical protein